MEYIHDQFDGHNYTTSANPFFVDRADTSLSSNTLRVGAAVKW